MARKKYTSIGIEPTQLTALYAVKTDLEHKSERTYRWGDFLMMLLTLKGDGLIGDQLPAQPLIAHMGQGLEEEEEASGEDEVEEIPFFSPLSDEECSRIADQIIEKLAPKLDELFRKLKEAMK